ncbi:Hypothetical protein DHA2_151137, partial [Giardia duodenalis]
VGFLTSICLAAITSSTTNTEVAFSKWSSMLALQKMNYSPGNWLRSPLLAEAMYYASCNREVLAPESKAHQYIQSRHILTVQRPRRQSQRSVCAASCVPNPPQLGAPMVADEVWRPNLSFFASSLPRFLGNVRRVPGALDSILFSPIQRVDLPLSAPTKVKLCR